MALADENTTAVTKATLHAVLYVADEIMHERAVLLPSVSKVFLAAYTTDSETDSNVHVLEVGEGTVKYTTVASSDEECMQTEIVTDFHEIIYSATDITDI